MTFNGINLNNVDDLMNRTYSSKEPGLIMAIINPDIRILKQKFSLDRRPLRWHSRLAVTIYQQAADDFGKQKFFPPARIWEAYTQETPRAVAMADVLTFPSIG